MFKNKKKLLIPLLLVVALMFSMLACDKGSPPKGNDGGGGGGQTQPETDIPKPEVPETEIPDIVIPDIDEDDLIGEADTEAAEAVIVLKGNTAEITGTGATVTTGKEYDIYNAEGVKTGAKTTYGTVVEISQSGAYVLQGTLNQGFVAISKKDLTVTLVLNGVNIYCENYAAITCLKKSEVIIELSEGSTNYLTDGGTGAADGKYAFGYDSEEQPNAALLIRKDLTIKGTGKLIVNGKLNNGIGSRANMTVMGGDITVYAVNNALKGNDSITIGGGAFTLVSLSDGVKTESVEDGLGFISITGGEFLITATNDGIQAATSLEISNAVIQMKTGGGSALKAGTDSAKGLKTDTDLIIHSGTFDIDSNDDCLHSNGTITINGGTFTIASADDGIHADNTLTINGGTINISKSYEGLESTNINLSGGTVRLSASDDGINISGGKDSSPTNPGRPGGGGFGGMPGGGGGVIDGTLTITGGSYYINATGDGLDSNGNIVMSGGLVVVYGPTSDQDAPIDYDGTFTMTGGTIIALGSSGMAQQVSSTSTQYSFLAKFSVSVAANSLINVSSTAGTEIVTIKTLKSTKSIVVCSPLLAKGSYKISSGGSHSGAINEFGIYTDGSYTGGTVVKTFTISNIITTAN